MITKAEASSLLDFMLRYLSARGLDIQSVPSLVRERITEGLGPSETATPAIGSVSLRRSAAQGAHSDLYSDDKDIEEGLPKNEIFSTLESSEFSQKLERLSNRMTGLDDYEKLLNPAKLKQFMGYIYEAIGISEELQQLIKSEAQKLSVKIHGSRELWKESASDEDIDREDEILFWEEFEDHIPNHYFGSALNFLIRQGSYDDATHLSGSLQHLILSQYVQESRARIPVMQKGLGTALTVIAEIDDGAQISRASLIDRIESRAEGELDEADILSFLEVAEGKNAIKIVKRSGRYYVEKAPT